MNEEIVRRFNEKVKPEDTVYILGDLIVGVSEKELSKPLSLLSSLNGTKYVIRGNHDSQVRRTKYLTEGGIESISPAMFLDYKGYHFYLTHYPCLTSNFETHLKQCVISLFGHTHQTSNFYYGIPTMYHVGLDSHNCKPVSLDEIIEDIKRKAEETNYFKEEN